METNQIPTNVESPEELLGRLESTDLSTVERDFPVLCGGDYVAKIDKYEVKPNSKGTGHNLVWTFILQQKAKATNGRELNIGFPLTHWTSLVSTDHYNPLETLAAIQEAALGARGPFRPQELLGRSLIIRIKIKKDENDEDRARITGFKKMPAPSTL
jgi:hypothetical protein